MRNSFNKTVINADTCLDKLFAVAGDSRGKYLYPVADEGIDLLQLFCDNAEGLTLIRLIMAVKQFTVGGNENELGGGRACVYTEIGIPRIGVYIYLGKVIPCVALLEGFIFLFALKQPLSGDYIVAHGSILYH